MHKNASGTTHPFMYTFNFNSYRHTPCDDRRQALISPAHGTHAHKNGVPHGCPLGVLLAARYLPAPVPAGTIPKPITSSRVQDKKIDQVLPASQAKLQLNSRHRRAFVLRHTACYSYAILCRHSGSVFSVEAFISAAESRAWGPLQQLVGKVRKLVWEARTKPKLHRSI